MRLELQLNLLFLVHLEGPVRPELHRLLQHLQQQMQYLELPGLLELQQVLNLERPERQARLERPDVPADLVDRALLEHLLAQHLEHPGHL